MILTLSIFCLILTFLGYYRTKKYIAPTVLAPLSWGAILFMYALFDHGMSDITPNVLAVIFIWVTSLSLGAWFFSEISISNKREKYYKKNSLRFNPNVRTIYYFIAVFGTIPLLYIAYKQATTMIGGGGFLFNLRMANTGIIETEYDYGIWQYAFVFAYISLLIEQYCYKKGDSKQRLIILLIINLLQAIITMAKSSFFFLFLAIGIVEMSKKKLKTKTIIIGVGAIISLMSAMQLLRSSNDDSKDVLFDMLYVYTMGGIPALDQIVTANMQSIDYGQMTLRFFKTIGSIIGSTEPSQISFINDITLKGYVFVPLPTNVFTVIGPFWWDFGYSGVFIFGVIMGAFCGLIYRAAQYNKLWAIIVYAYLASVLILQFFGEYIFTNLSYTIQIVLLSLFANKLNYTIKWRK